MAPAPGAISNHTRVRKDSQPYTFRMCRPPSPPPPARGPKGAVTRYRGRPRGLVYTRPDHSSLLPLLRRDSTGLTPAACQPSFCQAPGSSPACCGLEGGCVITVLCPETEEGLGLAEHLVPPRAWGVAESEFFPASGLQAFCLWGFTAQLQEAFGYLLCPPPPLCYWVWCTSRCFLLTG